MLGFGLGVTDLVVQRPGGTPLPALDLNFLSGALPSAVTFTRASSATRVNSAGTLETVATNAPRFDYDPLAVTNLLLWSEQFSNASWARVRSDIAANVAIDPLGGTTADKLTEQTDVATNRNIGQTIAITSGVTYTVSVYAKAAERDAINLRFGSGFAAGNVSFNLTTGTVTNGGTVAGSAIVSAGNGWWRCSASFVATSTTTAGAQIFLATGTIITYNGTAGYGALIWGAMAETASSAVGYAATTSATVTAFIPRGLLIEESRANAFTYSEDFGNSWSLAAGGILLPRTHLAPNGMFNGDTLICIDPSSGVSKYIYKGATFTSGVVYCLSGFFKPINQTTVTLTSFQQAGACAFTLTGNGTVGTPSGIASAPKIEAFPNGWYRCSVTLTASATGSNNLGFSAPSNSAVGHLWAAFGAMLETGNAATSYIPTPATWTARASIATYYNSTGVLTQAASGVARSTHRFDGTNWISAGPLLEGAQTNLIPGTMNTTTYWTMVGSATIAQAGTSPTGAADAFTITEPASTSSFGANVATAQIPTITAGTLMTGSVFAKAGTCNILRFFLADQGSPTISAVVFFNLTSGTIGTTTGVANITSAIQNIGGGWFRCSVSAILSTATTATVLLRMVSADNVTTDTGSKTMLFYGPQLETGGLSSYIPSTTATASRVADTSTSAAVTRAEEKPTVASLAGWYNASEGTMLTEYSLTSVKPLGIQVAAIFDNGSQSNRIGHFAVNSAGVTATNIDVAGVAQYNHNYSAPVAGTVYRHATGWAANNFITARNNTLGTADTSGTIPAVTQLTIGHRGTTTEGLNGHMRRLRVFGARLPSPSVQSITL
jgi:hypothetical protein